MVVDKDAFKDNYYLYVFLQMLSVEGVSQQVLDSWPECNPVENVLIHSMARRCFEAYVYVDIQSSDDRKQKILEVWREYASMDISQKQQDLEKVAKSMESISSGDMLYQLYQLYKGELDASSIEMMEEYYIKTFVPSNNGYKDIVNLLCRMKNKAGEYPISAESINALNVFCNSVSREGAVIEDYYESLYQKAEICSPSRWEALLQIFLFDGAVGSNYTWINSARNCALYKNYVHCVRGLVDTINQADKITMLSKINDIVEREGGRKVKSALTVLRNTLLSD